MSALFSRTSSPTFFSIFPMLPYWINLAWRSTRSLHSSYRSRNAAWLPKGRYVGIPGALSHAIAALWLRTKTGASLDWPTNPHWLWATTAECPQTSPVVCFWKLDTVELFQRRRPLQWTAYRVIRLHGAWKGLSGWMHIVGHTEGGRVGARVGHSPRIRNYSMKSKQAFFPV